MAAPLGARPLHVAAEAGIAGAVSAHLVAITGLGFARETIAARAMLLSRFVLWTRSQRLEALSDLTLGTLEAYRGWVSSRRRLDGRPLAWSTHAHHLTAVRMLLSWATRTRRIDANPASDLVLPRQSRRLPRAVLSAREAELVMAAPSLGTRTGLRDRAVLETLYSTGIRRMELVALESCDVEPDRQVLFVREGKGRKDRVVPIGARALGWVARYLAEVRPAFVAHRDPGALFVTSRGTRIRPSRLTERLHRYIQSAGVPKSGSVHIFRHTMATLMHDGGADIRDLQEILGHARLETTERYTHVSIERLREVHARTHPAERDGVGASSSATCSRTGT